MVQFDDGRGQLFHLVPMTVNDSNTFTETNDINSSDSRLYRLLTTGNS